MARYGRGSTSKYGSSTRQRTPSSSKFRTVGKISGGKAPIYLYGMEDLYDIADKAQGVNHAVEGLHNHFVKWFDKEGGGLLSYRLAVDMAAYIKSKLIENKDIPDPKTPLSSFWRGVKDQYHPSNVDKFGVASGKLADSIKAKKWSGKSGRWMVTVEGTYSGTPGYQGGGKIKDVGIVGSLLEFGMEGPDADPGLGGGQGALHVSEMKAPNTEFMKSKRSKSKKGKHEQPPRPWFWPAFHDYIEEKMPDLLDRMFVNKFNKYYQRLAKATNALSDRNLNKYAPIDSEDIVYYGDEPEDISDMSEAEQVFTMSTMQGKGETAATDQPFESVDSMMDDVYEDYTLSQTKEGQGIVWDAITGESHFFDTLKEAERWIKQMVNTYKKAPK